MGTTEPLERVGELRQLAAMLAEAAEGHGQVCVIEGPSGVGKSVLLDECARAAGARGMNVLRARCSELIRDYPFGVVRNLFEAEVMRADTALRDQMMQGPAALSEPVFGNGQASEEFGVVHGLYWLTVNLAERRPMVILVDDVLWADDLSLRFLAYLAQRIDDLPVVLVVTIRSGDPGYDSPLIGHLWDALTCPPIQPADLTGDAVETLLNRTVGSGPVCQQVARDVFRQTSGNPFLVVALADAIHAGEDPSLSTPDSVRRRMAARLARVDPAVADLVKAGAVLSDDTALRLGIRLAGLETEHGLAASEKLLAGRFFASADPMVFTHSIIRTAIYGLIEPSDRMALHSRAARLLAEDGAAPEIVAEHLVLSGATGGEWALQALHHAGRASANKGAPAAALRYLRHAVDAAPAEGLPPRLHIDLGLAEAATGEPLSLQRFEHALTLIDEPHERADALYSLGESLYRFGRFAEASATFHRGAELCEGADEQVRLRFVGAGWSADTHLAPLQRGQGHVVIGDADGPGSRAVLAVEALHQSLIAPPAARAADLALRALGDGALLSEQGSQGPSINLAVLALLHSGHLIEAQNAADAVVHDARMRGAQLAYAEASVIRALVLHTCGRINDAAADAQAALEILQPKSHSHAQTALAVLIHCLTERGEFDEAVRLLANVDADELAPTPAINAFAALARGRLHLRRRDLDKARIALVAAESAASDFDTANPAALPWRSLTGVFAHISGDEVRGRELIDEEIRLARLFEVSIPLGVALQRRAFTESAGQALETFAEAVHVLSDTEAKVHLARAHAGLGRRMRRAGHRVNARHHLSLALDLADRSGATGLVAEVREELTAAGARPRRASVTGVESLTPTELRVAQLAADGLSNRDIAEHTFVSRNTVAWHLRNIYRKLQVDSRDQLALPAHR